MDLQKKLMTKSKKKRERAWNNIRYKPYKSPKNLFRSTIKCGTVHAMAPEMFGGDDKGYSFEIDHYSFGILLYELLLG